MLAITLLYAGLLGVVSIALVFGVGSARSKANVSIGTGDSDELFVATRRHSNFVEYVPLALILMGLLEFNGVNTIAIHCFGVILVVSRICHPIGLRAGVDTHPMRFIGAVGTALVTVVMSIWAVVAFFMP